MRLSNLFGGSGVVVSEARLAKSTGASAIDAASDRSITVGGARTFSIPAGGEALSDELALSLGDGADVAISVYLATPTPLQTGHKSAISSTYVVPGSHAADTSLSSTDMRMATYWLSEIDAANATRTNVLVAFGDSITEGSGSTRGAHKSYPEQLFGRAASAINPRISIVIAGIGGNRWLADDPGPSGASRFERDVLGVQGVTHVIVLLGINDFEVARLFGAPPVTAQALIAAASSATARARQRGVKVLLGTLLPYKGSSLYNADDDAQRHLFNDWIRQQSGADAIVDFDRALQDPADPLALAPQFASSDRLHPNDAGYAAMAAAVDLSSIAP